MQAFGQIGQRPFTGVRNDQIPISRADGEDEDAEAAARSADTVIQMETELAKDSKSRVELRDPNANYHKLTLAELHTLTPHLDWPVYFKELGLSRMKSVIVGQTNFFHRLDRMVQERPLADFQTYLRWHVVRGAAPALHAEAVAESFAFYGTTLRGQLQPEPRWQRSAKVVDAALGEALGRMYVEKHFPAAALARMNELVNNVQEVFQERLRKLDWMSEATRKKALAKFDRFTRKIGHPEKFRDYSKVVVRRDDYYGNLRRASLAENKRQLARVGQAVQHRTERDVLRVVDERREGRDPERDDEEGGEREPRHRNTSGSTTRAHIRIMPRRRPTRYRSTSTIDRSAFQEFAVGANRDRAATAAAIVGGQHGLARGIDDEVARLKLAAMRVSIDTLTEEQETYLNSWELGTH